MSGNFFLLFISLLIYYYYYYLTKSTSEKWGFFSFFCFGEDEKEMATQN